jgi:hypothetical protein
MLRLQLSEEKAQFGDSTVVCAGLPKAPRRGEGGPALPQGLERERLLTLREGAQRLELEAWAALVGPPGFEPGRDGL